jgi:RNA polymerase sigma factor, sigma-70 family
MAVAGASAAGDQSLVTPGGGFRPDPAPWCDLGRGWYSQSNMDNRSDAIIVAEVLAGDTEAYACLVNRYQNEYFRFAVRMLGGRDDADEALQSAFLRAFRALAQCREPERFGAWLYQIVANECRSKATMRARRERRFVRDDDALASALAEQPAEPAAMDEEIERAIEQLEVDQREAFLLKYVEELTYEEMEAITGAGKSALKMRVKRACDRLRELLDGAYHA